MTVTTTTHLNFRGNARAALGFYQAVFGGEQMVVTYEDPHNVPSPAESHHVMYGQVVAESGFRVMAYDVPADWPHDPGQAPFFVSVRGNESEEIATLFKKLAVEGVVIAPLEQSAWSPLYGMVKDRFGITWVLDVEVKYGGS